MNLCEICNRKKVGPYEECVHCDMCNKEISTPEDEFYIRIEYATSDRDYEESFDENYRCCKKCYNKVKDCMFP